MNLPSDKDLALKAFREKAKEDPLARDVVAVIDYLFKRQVVSDELIQCLRVGPSVKLAGLWRRYREVVEYYFEEEKYEIKGQEERAEDL